MIHFNSDFTFLILTISSTIIYSFALSTVDYLLFTDSYFNFVFLVISIFDLFPKVSTNLTLIFFLDLNFTIKDHKNFAFNF